MIGTLAATLVIYGVLTIATFAILIVIQRRWQAQAGQPEAEIPHELHAGLDALRPGARRRAGRPGARR